MCDVRPRCTTWIIHGERRSKEWKFGSWPCQYAGRMHAGATEPRGCSARVCPHTQSRPPAGAGVEKVKTSSREGDGEGRR